MTTILFVHGTGIRKKRYDGFFSQIKKGLEKLQPELKLESCIWGETEGVNMEQVRLVIPVHERPPLPETPVQTKKLIATSRIINSVAGKTYGRSWWGIQMNEKSAFTGDILLYQARGEGIRRYIRQRIEELEGPVVVLAHSLGGVACVDLLVEEPLPKVALLITFGSQAPYFYVLNALPSLKKGEPLPDHFPDWVNIYNPRDYLSFTAEKVFPGRVKDCEVKSMIPFPLTHDAYWFIPQFFTIIADNLKARQLI